MEGGGAGALGSYFLIGFVIRSKSKQEGPELSGVTSLLFPMRNHRGNVGRKTGALGKS